MKIPAPTWSDEFGLPDGSYLISDNQEMSIFCRNVMKMLIIHELEYM